MVTTQVPEPLCMHVQNWENFCGGDNSGARTTEPSPLVNEKGKKESNRVFCVGNTQFVLAGNAGFSECLANMVLASVTISWCY